ncbi:cation:proton antiporter [Candidatus Babeliales bacterium]|nr:cation:proton antiporter [Candidatus Babeliales bacterium]
MKGAGFWSFISVLWYGIVFAQKDPYTVPQSILFQSGLDTTFVAKCSLFIAILLLGTLFFGKVFKLLFKIPSIAGQILGGIILGPSFINFQKFSFFTEPMRLSDAVSHKLYYVIPSDLFIFFILLLSSAFTVSYLLWLAGYETNVKDLIKVGATAVGAGIFGAIIPIIMIGGGLYWLFPGLYSVPALIGIGLVFAATSVSIPVAMLVSSNKMHLKSSQATLGAAIADDIFAVVLLSLFMMSVQSGLFGSVEGIVFNSHGCSIGKSLLFMIVSALVIISFGFFLIGPITQKLKNLKYFHLMAPVATGIMFIYFAFAELVGGLAGITGAYFAGVFQRSADKQRVAEKVCAPFVNAILLPLFLGSIGLQVDLHLLSYQQWIIAGFIFIISIISKLVGCALATGISNFSERRKTSHWSLIETYLFGASMVARGEVGLVVATILRGSQIISPETYVLCVVVIVLTTVAAPIMLSIGFRLMETYAQESGSTNYELDLGKFKVIGTKHMFNIISSRLEKNRGLSTTVQISEGREIIDIEEYEMRVIYSPTSGIRFEGNQIKIAAFIAEIKADALAEIEEISLH